MTTKFWIGLAVVTAVFLGLILYTSQDRRAKGQETTSPPEKVGFEVIDDPMFMKLWACESSYMPDVKHLDTDHKWVYGPIQYKADVFVAMAMEYHLDYSDIYSPVQQEAVFRRAIKDGKWYLWTNCGKKIGLDKFIPPPQAPR